MSLLDVGEFLPPMALPGVTNPRYRLSSVAGRWTVLLFLPRQGKSDAPALDAALAPIRARFDDNDAVLFVITPRLEELAPHGHLHDTLPGIRVLADPEGKAAAACGVEPTEGAVILADPFHRVFRAGPLEQAGPVLGLMAQLPRAEMHAGTETPPPVLVLPRVLEPELCRELIELYERQGGAPSGVMREENGRTVHARDDRFKRRSDLTIEDPRLLASLHERIANRLVPAIWNAFLPRDEDRTVHRGPVRCGRRWLLPCTPRQHDARYRASAFRRDVQLECRRLRGWGTAVP